MKIRYSILGILLTALMITSCIDDLNVTPKDKDVLLAGIVADDPELLKQFLGKTYASFIISGQGPDNGGADISGGDENFFTTMRALWNLQEITTDEAMCAWGDVGIADLNTQTWSPSNPFLTALYQRLSLSITFANEFIRLTEDSSEPEIITYHAEARFLRALAYSWAIDLFGQFPFTTEEDGIGKFFPNIGTREQLYNYVETELLEIQDQLSEPGTVYPQADKAAAWMLLAKIYLNAEVYTGTPMWEECVAYVNKVEQSGVYSLNPNYRQNFSADNHFPVNPEMIFAWEEDGTNSQGWVGTTFIIQSSSDPDYIPSEDFHGLTSNTNWNGNRTRRNFLDVILDTMDIYSGGPVPTTDTFFTASADGRVYLKQKATLSIPSAGSDGNAGIGVYKFTALNSDGTQPATYSTSYACTDYPIFRYADALLMRAEANHNLADDASAASDINTIRERAFGDASHNIAAAEVTDKVILDERGREFYFEGHRRTDLIRHGLFTGGAYNWTWKGGVYDGTDTDTYRDLFPIPGDEISANPNYNGDNNPGY
jgi:starch-binding outer membrane protein, SusD/RagB family